MLYEQTKDNCDFCNYGNFTALDALGRIETVHSYTAANAFKLDRWHGLVMLRKHHPFNWNEEQFLDLMSTMMKW